MIKEKIIRVDVKGGEDWKKNVLFWNEQTQAYYCMSPEVLLGPQDNKIKELEEEFMRTKQSYKEHCLKLEIKFEEERNAMKKEFDELLATQKEVNEKLISMVENFIKGGKE